MQEQQSRWTSALSWVTAKTPVFALTFATQVTSTVADYCFQLPRNVSNLFWLNCVNYQQLVNLSRDLATQANATAVNIHACYDTTFPFHNWKTYGTTYFGNPACHLSYFNTLDPLINNILSANTKSGIYGGAYDGWMTFAIVAAGVGTVSIAALAAALFYKRKCGRNAQTQTTDENSRLFSDSDNSKTGNVAYV